MKRLLQILTIIPVIIILFIIFGFSSQNAEESSSTSGRMVAIIADVIFNDFDKLPEVEARIIIDNITHIVRKLAHFSEFFLLGFFSSLHILALLYDINIITIDKIIPITWTFGTIIAASDEFHQLFVPGRAGSLEDIVIDSYGVLSGTLIFLLILSLFRRLFLHMLKVDNSFFNDKYR